MKILITTPFFQFSGGSELETIHTANTFASFAEVKEVHVFVAGVYNLKFTENIYINEKVKFFRRPDIFDKRYFYKLNNYLKKKLNLEALPFDFIYWKFKKLSRFDKLYIITKSTLASDYIPLIKLYKSKNNIVIKYTTIFFQPLENVVLKYLSQIRYNIVTSQKQKDFFVNQLNLKNAIAQEILLFNENLGVKKVRTKKDVSLYDFGILGRYSEEKQYEHAINLIENLRNKGFESTLIIKGGCDEDYYKSLIKLVKEKNLEDLITLSFEEVSYDKVYDFFDVFNCFLITSKYEGGPNVGLEVMAYGLPILSYDVGAMKDRLNKFPELIALNEENLTKKAIEILNYEEVAFLQKCDDIKKEYTAKFSNNTKISFLKDFLENK
ncbi:glycosyltransferase [Flavobacterium sp. 17A]|uniref:Glycosyltransferase n=1 Tax=Flavobacterium potami TaxID=2872310 RepID=A0A9X1HCE7_9FLAO|nr:glycosyltransferase [Flavobacterium potami]MBZ4036566.1 glycosyltransferase [Flavobacterium potami]